MLKWRQALYHSNFKRKANHSYEMSCKLVYVYILFSQVKDLHQVSKISVIYNHTQLMLLLIGLAHFYNQAVLA